MVDGVGATAVLVHPRAHVEGGRRQVHPVPDEDHPTTLGATTLEPVHVPVVDPRLVEDDPFAGEDLGGAWARTTRHTVRGRHCSCARVCHRGPVRAQVVAGTRVSWVSANSVMRTRACLADSRSRASTVMTGMWAEIGEGLADLVGAELAGVVELVDARR